MGIQGILGESQETWFQSTPPLLKLSITMFQGSHFSGLTKFPDFSRIFFQFSSIFYRFVFFTENFIHFSK